MYVCCFPVPTNFGNAASNPSILMRDISTNCLETSAAKKSRRIGKGGDGLLVNKEEKGMKKMKVSSSP
ncbi:hypothetical protein CKAN_02292400 [Cinnamomum micranthum f. kanehirae]|uniref:Uncharacterized protein n=1 Tax=Cinnamomum micranthum f. kanehirae TaxID=337451 RepID=A0A3S3N767_9MAGN|nr:hypothetical protein CKAN_02292400 [Cinnamomum micranthum f. kanehirae]